ARGDGFQFKHGLRGHCLVVAGEFSEGSFGSPLTRQQFPFDHDLTRRRNLHVDCFTFDNVDRLSHPTAGNVQFVQVYGSRDLRAQGNVRIVADCEGDLQRFSLAFNIAQINAKMLRWNTPATHGFAIVDLHPADRNIVAVLRMSRETEPYSDERPGVFRIVRADRKATEIRVVAGQNDFFAGPIFDQTWRYVVL